MTKVLCIGGITYDMYFAGNLPIIQNKFSLAVGGKYPTLHYAHHVGGGAVNTGIGLSRRGHKVSILGVLGKNEYIQTQKDLLKKVGIDHSLCVELEGYYNVSSILLTGTGERSVVNYEQEGQQLHFSRLHIATASQHDLVYIANLPDVPLKERALFAYEIKRINPKVIIFTNIGISDCRKQSDAMSFLQHVDGITINTTEYSELIEMDEDTINFLHHTISYDSPLYGKHVILTQGSKGSHYYFKDSYHHQDALPVSSIVDTTGAGDAFTAGFLSGFMEKKAIPECLYFGASQSATILGVLGAHEDVGIG